MIFHCNEKLKDKYVKKIIGISSKQNESKIAFDFYVFHGFHDSFPQNSYYYCYYYY